MSIDHERIRKLHSRNCPSNLGNECSCNAGWQVRITIPGRPGQASKRVSKTFKSQRDAIRWIYEQEALIEQGHTHSDEQTGSLVDAFNEWFDRAEAGAIATKRGTAYKPSTLRDYRGLFERQIAPTLGDRQVGSLVRKDIQGFIDLLAISNAARGGKVSGRTVRNVLTVLQVICQHLHRRELISTNPCVDIALPPVNAKEVEFLEPEELEDLINALPIHDAALYGTAGYAGLRLGEILALRWDDIDLANRRVHITRSWDSKSGKFVDPKSKAGRRHVPVNSRLEGLLRTYEASLNCTHSGSDLVFPRASGIPQAPSSLEQRLRRTWDAAGLRTPTRVMHTARHTFASMAIAAGINVKALSTYLGHGSVAITLDTYGHLYTDETKQSSEMLDAFLSERGNRATNGQRVGNQLEKA